MLNKMSGLPEIPAARGDDLHNIQYIHNADLVLFMDVNQCGAMGELIEAFQRRHPEVEKIFYETLPQALELKQIISGGAQYKDIIIDVTPDIFTSASEDIMTKLTSKRYIEKYFPYLHNRLVLMVQKGNPKGIREVRDLASDDIRVSQPGSKEEISNYVVAMYQRADGNSFANRILEEKRAEGTTILTIAHQRETPLRLDKGTVDVGPVWSNEMVNAKNKGNKVEAVEPGSELDQRDNISYYIGKMKRGKNPENAEKFLDFVRSPSAQDIYERYGFVPYLS